MKISHQISESQFTLTLDSSVNGKRFLQTDHRNFLQSSRPKATGGLKGNVKFRFGIRVNPISAENFANFLPVTRGSFRVIPVSDNNVPSLSLSLSLSPSISAWFY